MMPQKPITFPFDHRCKVCNSPSFVDIPIVPHEKRMERRMRVNLILGKSEHDADSLGDLPATEEETLAFETDIGEGGPSMADVECMREIWILSSFHPFILSSFHPFNPFSLCCWEYNHLTAMLPFLFLL
jgi:hypothetical protein